MRKRISRVAPFQMGKVFAVLYALFSIPFALIMGVFASFGPPGQSMPLVMIVAIPVFYVVFGFLFTALAAWLYNVVAKWTGGIEYMTVEVPDA
jgi:hypothetical protein